MTDRNADMRHILSQVKNLTSTTLNEGTLQRAVEWVRAAGKCSFWIINGEAERILDFGVHDDATYENSALVRPDDDYGDDPDQVDWMGRALEAGWIRVTTNSRDFNIEVVASPAVKKNVPTCVQLMKMFDLQAVHFEVWPPGAHERWDGQGAPAKQITTDVRGAIRTLSSL